MGTWQTRFRSIAERSGVDLPVLGFCLLALRVRGLGWKASLDEIEAQLFDDRPERPMYRFSWLDARFGGSERREHFQTYDEQEGD